MLILNDDVSYELTLATAGGSSPASMSRTDQSDTSVRRLASTQPADPAPITIKSNF